MMWGAHVPGRLAQTMREVHEEMERVHSVRIKPLRDGMS